MRLKGRESTVSKIYRRHLSNQSTSEVLAIDHIFPSIADKNEEKKGDMSGLEQGLLKEGDMDYVR